MGSRDIQLTLVILPQGCWEEVKGWMPHTHFSLLPPQRCETFSHSAASSLFISSGFLSSPLPVTNHSSLTKSTFNLLLGPLVLPDREGWVLAAVCDPTLINRVGEGKGAMHTPIHYLIRMAHTERWAPSLYLNDKGWTQHSVRYPIRLLRS